MPAQAAIGTASVVATSRNSSRLPPGTANVISSVSPASSTATIGTLYGRGTRTPIACSANPPEYSETVTPESRLSTVAASSGIGYHEGSMSARVSSGESMNPLAMPSLDAASSAP